MGNEQMNELPPASAHELLVRIYQDVSQSIEARIDAAKAAIAYEKPRLAAIKHSGDGDHPVLERVQIVVVDTGVPSSNGPSPSLD